MCGQNIGDFIEFIAAKRMIIAPVGFDSPGPVFSIINLPNFGRLGDAAHSYDLVAIETGGNRVDLYAMVIRLYPLMGDIAQTAGIA